MTENQKQDIFSVCYECKRRSDFRGIYDDEKEQATGAYLALLHVIRNVLGIYGEYMLFEKEQTEREKLEGRKDF